MEPCLLLRRFHLEEGSNKTARSVDQHSTHGAIKAPALLKFSIEDIYEEYHIYLAIRRGYPSLE